MWSSSSLLSLSSLVLALGTLFTWGFKSILLTAITTGRLVRFNLHCGGSNMLIILDIRCSEQSTLKAYFAIILSSASASPYTSVTNSMTSASPAAPRT
jgi:hypothetical protein